MSGWAATPCWWRRYTSETAHTPRRGRSSRTMSRPGRSRWRAGSSATSKAGWHGGGQERPPHGRPRKPSAVRQSAKKQSADKRSARLRERASERSDSDEREKVDVLLGPG